MIKHEDFVELSDSDFELGGLSPEAVAEGGARVRRGLGLLLIGCRRSLRISFSRITAGRFKGLV